jgi:hypothetical protein
MSAHSLRATLSACICSFIERDVSCVIPSREATLAEKPQAAPTPKGRHRNRTGFTPSAFSKPLERRVKATLPADAAADEAG